MMTRVTTPTRFALALCCAGCTAIGTSAKGQHDHADINVGAQAGQIVTLLETGEEIFTPTRVFEAELPTDSYFTDAPGFNNDERADFPAGIGALNPNAAVSFDFVSMALPGQSASNLLFWDGAGATPTFSAIGDGTTFSASKLVSGSTFLTATVDGGPAGVSGFDIDTTDGSGGIHKHINFYLEDSSNTIANIADGIYVVGLVLEQAGLTSSDPFYLVFATEGIDESAHEAAAEFIETTLVPEPTTAGLLAVGAVVLARRRRLA